MADEQLRAQITRLQAERDELHRQVVELKQQLAEAERARDAFKSVLMIFYATGRAL